MIISCIMTLKSDNNIVSKIPIPLALCLTSHNTCITNSQSQLLIGQVHVGLDMSNKILVSSLLNYSYRYNKLWHENSSAFNMNSNCVSVIQISFFYHGLKSIANFMLPFIFKNVVPMNDTLYPHGPHHAAFFSFLLVLDTPLISYKINISLRKC